MYYVVYGFLWLISLLPLRVLYLISDCIYGLMFYVIKYRKEVVMNNLLIAFPEKSEVERTAIAKKFYRNLIDTFIETIKMITVSKKFILKRCKCNWEVINDLKATGRSVQVHLGHNFNWEWGNLAGAENINFPFLAVYMPISNRIFERIFYKLRTRGGTKMLRATHMAQDFVPYRNTQYLMGLVADQNPGSPGGAWWFDFFGRPTPFVKGPAKAAILNDTAVVFAFINRPRRGYYEGVLTLAEHSAKSCDEIPLTGKFVQYLETVIREYPDMWLWSHRRWKHEWKEEYGPVYGKG
jgi:KDO2-lipid IV(A) lauroyltransferase